MSLLIDLQARSHVCELCNSSSALGAVHVAPHSDDNIATSILACDICQAQISGTVEMDTNHWRCLNESMWSEVDAVKVVAWRLLHRLQGQGEDWAQDLLGMMYMEPDVQSWAEAGSAETSEAIVHKDSNGHMLAAGDTVTLIKDLDVKGSSLTAKRGTSVRNISLVADDAGQIEGRVEGQRIVILTQYVKKIK